MQGLDERLHKDHIMLHPVLLAKEHNVVIGEQVHYECVGSLSL
jgi:hypothetical protein